MKNIRTKLFKTVTEKVKQTALGFDENAQVILFGSRARGDYHKDSDWDFLILMDRQVNESLKQAVGHKIFDLELETDQIIFGMVENKMEWQDFEVTEIYQNIAEEGVLI